MPSRPCRPVRAIHALTIAVAVGAVLAGCATATDGSPAASATATPPASATPSPSASTGDQIEAPQPFIGTTCDALISPASLAAGFSEPVSALEVVENIQLTASDGPLRFALQQIGGIECEWSNGEPYIADSGRNPGYVGVTLRVLPNAEEVYTRYSEYYGVQPGDQTRCGNGEPTMHCNVLVEGSWLEIELQDAGAGDGTNAEAVMTTLYNAVSSALAAGPTSSRAWTPPANTIPLESTDCDQFLSREDAASIVDLPGSVYFDGMDGGASLVASSWYLSGGSPCPWVNAEGHGQGVFLSSLPGGEWAWLEQARPESYEMVEVPGLAPDDAVWLECPTPAVDCAVDLIVGHNWIQIRLNSVDADSSAVLVQLAAKVVARVRG